MNPILFAIILIRTLSVYFVLQGIMLVSQNVAMSLLMSDTPGGTPYHWPYMAWFVIPLLAGGLLWIFAPYISQAIVGKDAYASGHTPLTTESVLGAAISVAGLLIVVTHIPTLIVAWTRYAADVGDLNSNPSSIVYLIGQVLEVAFGLALCVGVRAWVRVIKFLRGLGRE